MEDPGVMGAALIGAGRVGDKVVAGVKQLFNDSPELAAIQKGNDQAYAGLQQQHPIATAVGEALPSLAIPMGGATTAARLAIPALSMGAIGAAEYGSPLERASRGAIGAASGLAGGALGQGLSRIALPVQSDVPSVARAAADKIGAPMLPSQITGSPTLARVEDALSRMTGSAGVMQDFLAGQQGAVKNAAAAAVRSTPDNLTNLPGIRAALGNEYTQMRALIPDGMPAQQPVFDAIAKAEERLSQGSASAQGKSTALSLLSELKDKLYSTKALTPAEYSAWVSDIGAEARSATNDTVKAALKGVGAEMDKAARGPLAPEWKNLDQAYAAAKVLQKSNAVNPQTGDIALQRLAGYMQRNPSGANATPLADVAAYARTNPLMRAGSPTAERESAGTVGGLLGSLYRYPAAKLLTSDLMRGYLSGGAALGYRPASNLLAGTASRVGIPMGMAPAAGLLSPFYLSQ
jgi:hypothetical protein